MVDSYLLTLYVFTFAVKEEIENSRVFQTIRRLPKGGIIHVHDFSMTSIDWVIKNVTYRNNLYDKL